MIRGMVVLLGNCVTLVNSFPLSGSEILMVPGACPAQNATAQQASVRPIGDTINLMYIGLFSLGART